MTLSTRKVLYDLDSIIKEDENKKENKLNVIYGRVSTPRQKTDLNNQIEKLLTVSRKYKLQSPEQLPAYYENLQNRYEQLNQSLDIQTLKNNVEKHLLDYENKAKILTQKRQQAAQKMSVEVSKIMQKLALVDGKFIVNLIHYLKINLLDDKSLL